MSLRHLSLSVPPITFPVGLIYLLFFTILADMSPSSSAQVRPATIQHTASSEGRYLTKTLPISLETVGSHFKGHDIQAIINQLTGEPKNAPKSEFETSDDYEARIRTVLSSTQRQYVFVLDRSTTGLHYDADNKVMDVAVTAPLVTGLNDDAMREPNKTPGESSGIALRTFLVSHSRYLGTNALNVRVVVNSFTFNEYGIVLTNDDALFADTRSWESRTATATIGMDAQMAKDTKPFLSVALFCTLVTPTVYQGVATTTPTITSPVEGKITKRYILVRPDQFWIYDVRSGKVLKKCLPAKPVLLSSLPETTEPLEVGNGEIDHSVQTISVLQGEQPERKAESGVPSGPTSSSASTPSGELPTDNHKEILYSATPVIPPVVLYSPEAEYSDEALKAKCEGTVVLKVQIELDGTVSSERILVARSLGFGLDEKAIEAVKRWKFKPAHSDGRPVVATVTIEIGFRLEDR